MGTATESNIKLPLAGYVITLSVAYIAALVVY